MFDLLAIKAFFSKYLVIGLLVAIAAGATYHIIMVTIYKSEVSDRDRQISDLQTSNANLASENSTLTSTNTQFKTVADAQNQALTNLLENIANTQKKTYADLILAKKENEKYKTAYSEIFNLPNNKSNPCSSLGVRLDAYLDQREKEVVK